MPPFAKRTREERDALRAAKKAAAQERAEEAETIEAAIVAEEQHREVAATALAEHLASVPKWEYHLEVLEPHTAGAVYSWGRNAELAKLRKRMDALGQDGWELVTYGSLPLEPSTSWPVAFFKRPALPDAASAGPRPAQ